MGEKIKEILKKFVSKEMETEKVKRVWCDESKSTTCEIVDGGIEGMLSKRMEDRAWCDAIECQIYDIVLRALKPILAKFKDIILDSAHTIEEKVEEIWERAKDALQPIMSLVGNMEKTKEILKKFIEKTIAFDSPGGLAGL